ncbi:hypothetical protein KVR01_001877 [Diaporthe batatas]|uniref:uncharacterized protein n=1 Tax=Diaporthe batatas TaxID=748121 RepID=UPI001D04E351|nr:uncharacterized protein KVR01_001877 [Diaporthe batatas]KAG8169128.1 hypothetical protein KVR01_001877 [Diaporthe batatas]
MSSDKGKREMPNSGSENRMADGQAQRGKPRLKARTRSGCITCRIRRVKCDEARPSCNRCAQSKRQCDGYLTLASQQGSSSDDAKASTTSKYPGNTVSRRALAVALRQLNVVGPASRVLAAGAMVPGDAVSCFDFFRFRVRATTPTADRDALGDTPGFWDRTLLQTAHVEPAVWHAVAALGALQRKWEFVSRLSHVPLSNSESRCNGNGNSSNRDAIYSQVAQDTTEELEHSSVQLAGQASTNYVEALKLARTTADVKTILVLSIALAAASNLTGKWSDSKVHIGAAIKLIGQLADEAKGTPISEMDINDAADSLARLDMQWLTFQDAQAPYPYRESQLMAHALRRAPEIKSLTHAQDLLMGILRKLWVGAGLENIEKQGLEDIKHGDADILTELAQWEHKTLRFLSHSLPLARPASSGLLFLKICHATARLVIFAGITHSDYNEMSWDGYLAHFERIVALSALFIQAEVNKNPLLPSEVSLDGPGIIMSLWLVAFRCRHPMVRRRAVGLLRVSRRQEGMWMSTSAAVVAQKLVEIEEGGCPGWRGTMGSSGSALVPAFCTLEPITAFEQDLTKQFEAEDLDPHLWLSGEGLWVARTEWDLPGEQLIPLERRITEVSTFAEPYDPRRGKSKADITLFFAGLGSKGDTRREIVSVNF